MKLKRNLIVVGALGLSLLAGLAIPAAITYAAPSASYSIQADPAVELPPYQLPIPVDELLAWAFSSSLVIQLIRRASAAFDPTLGNGVGATLIVLVVCVGAVVYGSYTGAFGGMPETAEGWIGRVALLVLASATAYFMYIRRVVPDPPPAPAPASA